MKELKDYALLAVVVLVAVVVGGLALNGLQPSYTVGYGGLKYGPQMMSGVTASSGASAASSPWQMPWGVDRRLISSSGSIAKAYTPDEATLSFSVETLAKEASDSQAKNAEISLRVRNAIKAAGVAEDDIETSSYSLQQEYQWNELTRKSEPVGYRTSNSILVKVRDFSLTGKVIDAAVDGGVNRVDSVSFTLSKQKEAQVRAELLSQAAAMAKSKADLIASGFGAKVKSVYSASEGYSYIPMYNKYSMAVDSAGGAPRAETPISVGDVTVTVTVDAQFELE